MEWIDLTLPIDVESLEQATLDAPLQRRRRLSTRTWTLPWGATKAQAGDIGAAQRDDTTLPHSRNNAEACSSSSTATRSAPGSPTVEAYHARVHDFTHWSMAGTYLDLPGHIIETDDGMDAARLPLERLYRLPATLVRLERASGAGRIGAAELAAAAPARIQGQALIIHALGPRRFDEIEMRSVYLGSDAVQWIIDTGIRLLVADVYESDTDPQGVFPLLFRQGILAVCYPINLHRIRTPHPTLTVLPLRFRRATQLPCRVVVEQEDPP